MASRGKEGNGLYGGSNIKKTKETNSVLKDRLVTAHQRLKDLSHAPNNLLVGTNVAVIHPSLEPCAYKTASWGGVFVCVPLLRG